MRQHTISRFQLGAILFLAFAVDMVVRPFTNGNFVSAQGTILAAVIDTGLVLLIVLPVLSHLNSTSFSVLLKGGTVPAKVFLALSALLFAFGAGGAIVRAEKFYRYVSDEKMPVIVFLFLALITAFYAARCGIETIARAAGVILFLFALSMILVCIANLRQMRLENLVISPHVGRDIIQSAVRGISFPPEILLFGFFSVYIDKEKRRCFLRTMLILCLFYIGVTFFSELVLGAATLSQMQTMHTISRIGSISVFKRLDALHISIWMLAAFIRIFALFYGALQAVQEAVPERLRRQAAYMVVFLISVATAISYSVPPGVLRLLLSAATMLIFIIGILVTHGIGERYDAKTL